MRIGFWVVLFSAMVTASQGQALAQWTFTAPCTQLIPIPEQSPCQPIGVFGVVVTEVTGFFELDIAPGGSQPWGLEDVVSYSFTYGDFTISDANSELMSLFPTNSTSPNGQRPLNDAVFDGGGQDDLVFAVLDADPTVRLIIVAPGTNLAQGGGLCTGPQGGAADCQAVAINGQGLAWTPVPEPTTGGLLALGLGALVCSRPRRSRRRRP